MSLFSHYKPAESVIDATLSQIVSDGRTGEAARDAIRATASRQNHLNVKISFRAWVERDDRFTPEEKADLKRTSLRW